ncbi:MAG: alpha/beta hydrolase [Bacteroidota bacterium]
MKKLFVYVLLLLFLPGGCSGSLYSNLPSVEFQDIDYGFPTKNILSNPFISYINVGEGKKTILLIHGLASNAGFWRYVIPELSKNYRVIALDLPGYGKSEKGDYSYSMTFYADQIKRFADELKLDKFILVGHSMGGQIGITFALKYPDRLEKLVLASPAGVEEFEQKESDWLRSVISIAGIKKTNEEDIRKNLAMNFYLWSDKWEWMVEERVRLIKAKDFDEFAYAVVRSVNAMLDEPTFDKIKNISVPTLIIYGKYDRLIPNPYLNPGLTSDLFKWGAKQIPNCKIYEIDKCGHMLQIEKPEEFSNAVLDFIRPT